MKQIQSFLVDHDKLKPGLYISRTDGDIVTYDLRFKTPNAGDYLSNGAMHTIEHIFATWLRSSPKEENILYFGPMGCRTGFYLLVRGMDGGDVVSLVKEATAFTAQFDANIPGMSRIECGNYLEHDLSLAKKECARYHHVLNCGNNSLLY